MRTKQRRTWEQSNEGTINCRTKRMVMPRTQLGVHNTTTLYRIWIVPRLAPDLSLRNDWLERNVYIAVTRW